MTTIKQATKTNGNDSDMLRIKRAGSIEIQPRAPSPTTPPPTTITNKKQEQPVAELNGFEGNKTAARKCRNANDNFEEDIDDIDGAIESEEVVDFDFVAADVLLIDSSTQTGEDIEAAESDNSIESSQKRMACNENSFKLLVNERHMDRSFLKFNTINHRVTMNNNDSKVVPKSKEIIDHGDNYSDSANAREHKSKNIESGYIEKPIGELIITKKSDEVFKSKALMMERELNYTYDEHGINGKNSIAYDLFVGSDVKNIMKCSDTCEDMDGRILKTTSVYTKNDFNGNGEGENKSIEKTVNSLIQSSMEHKLDNNKIDGEFMDLKIVNKKINDDKTIDRRKMRNMTADANGRIWTYNACEELIEFINESFQSIERANNNTVYDNENFCDESSQSGDNNVEDIITEPQIFCVASQYYLIDSNENKIHLEESDFVEKNALKNAPLKYIPMKEGNGESVHNPNAKEVEQKGKPTIGLEGKIQEVVKEVKVQLKPRESQLTSVQGLKSDKNQSHIQKQQQQTKLSSEGSSLTSAAIASKAFKSKLTPLAPPFHPASSTATKVYKTATSMKSETGAQAVVNFSTVTQPYKGASVASATFYPFDHVPTIVLTPDQLVEYQQQFTLQQQYMQQQHGVYLQSNQQQQVSQKVPSQQQQLHRNQQQQQNHEQQLHHLQQQQSQHLILTTQQHQQQHQQHYAQHGLPHIQLHAPPLINNSSSNTDGSTAMQQVGHAHTTHAHLIPLQMISLSSSPPAPPAPGTPQAAAAAVAAAAAAVAVAAAADGAWPLAEAPIYIDANGEYRTFCPAHGPPLGTAAVPQQPPLQPPLLPTSATSSSSQLQQQLGQSTAGSQQLPLSAPSSPAIEVAANSATTAAAAHEPRVLLQLEAGVSLPLQIAGKRKVIRGPTTVQMVSQNRPPPMPVPVQVPQGQVMQQYVNENGTLTHVVLTPQQYQQLHAGQGHIHAPFLATNGTSHFYSPLATGFSNGPGGGGPTHFQAIPGGHLQHQPPPAQQQQQQQQASQQQPQQQQRSHSPSPPNSYHKDERTQRQHTKLRRKLDQKQREINSAMSTPAHSPSPRKNDMNGHHNYNNSSNHNNSHGSIQNVTLTTSLASNNSHHNHHASASHHHLQQQQQQNPIARRQVSQRNGAYSAIGLVTQQHGASSVGTSEDGEESSSVAEDEEDYQATIIEQLSAIQKPEVTEITSRSAKIIWEAPSNTDPILINQRDLRFNVLLSDRAKECKYKSLYKGESFDCIVQDLQPGQEYVVRLQVHYEKLQGSASEPTEFTTPPCEPDQPMPPKLVVRTKNSLHLRWTNPYANGSSILHYLLEYDEGKTGAPVSSRSARQHAGQLHFVEAIKTKGKQYILTKLQPSTVYNFRLAAINDVGSSLYSPICTYSTSGNPPTAPKPPTLQTVTSNSLRLVWDRRQQDVEFVLQMLNRESGHGFLNMYNGTDCVYECCQLRRATAYQFRLRADNDAGASPWSNEVTFKTSPEKPGCPGKPQVKGKIHGTYFKARWEPPSDRGGADILRYFLEISSGLKFERIYSGVEPEATCDRLQPGTTYQLRASCEGPAGTSAYSEVATVTSEAIAPVAPPPPYHDNPPGPYAAVLKLDKPDYNGGAPILEYEVQLRRSGHPIVDADCETEVEEPSIIYRGKESFCIAKDLHPGCEYETQARAINRIGAGAWSTWFKFTAAAAAPFAPAAPSIYVKSATQLIVNWIEPEYNGSAISEYRLESAAVSCDTEDLGDATVASSAFQTCYQGHQKFADLRNLLPFTLYFFRVNASNVAGVSKWSSIVNAKTPAAIPGAPQIKDYEFTSNEVTLSWSQPDCNGASITAYTIEYAEHSITTTNAATEYTITKLTPETSYKLRVQAINAMGNGPFSAYSKFTTLPPPPKPPALECTGIGHNFIKLKWGDGKNLDFTKFYVEMYVQRAKEFQVVYSGTNSMCKVNKLQEQTKYTFRICAGTDRAGVGEYSNEYVFSTTATLPSNIKAPRVAFEGGVCLLGPGTGALTGAAANIPSGMLPETPSSFIAGLGNLSLGVPLTLEWQHSKNSFNDRVEYVLQYAIGKDGDFKQIYRGVETKFTIENLEPGSTYQFRVCPIRVSSSNGNRSDLHGQFTSAFRYQVPHLPSIDVIDGSLFGNAAGMLGAGFGATQNNNCNNSNSNAFNAAFHGHSHHAHHVHHSHGHSHHAHNHAHHSYHNSRHSGSVATASTSTLHHRSVSASAVSSNVSGGTNGVGNSSGGTLFSGNAGNAIGLIPLGSSVTTASEFAANFTGCEDPHHHHHHHHHHAHQLHGSVVSGGASAVVGGDLHPSSATASLLAATAGSLLANNPLLANAAGAAAAATHAQNGGAIRRYTMKLTALYTNRKRFTDQEKAVMFMVSFLFFAFVFAALVKMLMR